MIILSWSKKIQKSTEIVISPEGTSQVNDKLVGTGVTTPTTKPNLAQYLITIKILPTKYLFEDFFLEVNIVYLSL